MPISLAASSQTQIGSSPFWNFRQRLSQSIIGTKQLKVEETDSGLPFFIQTRNRAGCSPSLVQEVGLRICSLPGLGALDSQVRALPVSTYRRSAARQPKRCSGLDNSITHGITHEFRYGVQLQFAHDVCSVSLHSLCRDIKAHCHVFAGLAFGK
jgi:hypothetical protein